ncbi:MAG: 1-hydroxycarotenoid 3,4-desaturase CrtD [Pseudomonadota bacterium]
MHIEKHGKINNRTLIIGAGMAGLAAAVCLSAKGENVVVLEAHDNPGGKMRQINSDIGGIDSGPTVFTMKYVFDKLFDLAGTTVENELNLEKATVLARHAWDDQGVFDLYADREQSTQAIAQFFDSENARGYERFCRDAGHIYETLKDTFMDAQRPGPLELGSRVGLTRLPTLWKLKPLSTLWSALQGYFPDSRLQQLFGRYGTYVGSSPFQAPATLMLIAHVEQEGVWLIKNGMFELSKALSRIAGNNGAEIRRHSKVAKIIVEGGSARGVELESGELLIGSNILYCGDVSDLPHKVTDKTRDVPAPVAQKDRSLSAITWSMSARTTDFPLSRHNVFFAQDYLEEFESIFDRGYSPVRPTVYICAQDREESENTLDGPERLLCLINAPANGDINTLTKKELEQCQTNMTATLNRCGLTLEPLQQVITQPSDFNKMFPGSGGALYGRASHGWTASFARPGAKTKIPQLYLAGGSVHPGAGVPMATLSGMLAAEQILKDRVLT